MYWTTRKESRKTWSQKLLCSLLKTERQQKQKSLAGTEEEKETAGEGYREKKYCGEEEHCKDMTRVHRQFSKEGKARTMYKIPRTVTGRFTRKTTTVKDKKGKVLMKEEQELHRQTGHLKKLMNNKTGQTQRKKPYKT